MTFAEKLRNIRKRAGMSQEKLAEKLGVSRQAITKWETDGGIPDIENVIAISNLFGISIDELLLEKKEIQKEQDYMFESITEYDIGEKKRYDLKLGGANTVILSGYDGEKFRIRLASNTLAALQSDFKVKIDDVRNRIDADLTRRNDMTEATAKEALTIFVQLPTPYLNKVELEVNTENLEIRSLVCESVEFDGKAKEVTLDQVVGAVELNCNLDMHILCQSLEGAVEINQLSSTSRIAVPEGTPFAAVTKGIGNSISYEKNGRKTECFAVEDSENTIELNGLKSELVICTL